MQKITTKRIIKGIVIFIFVVFFTQVIIPDQARAEVRLNWENPNSGRNPYKFNTKDVLNSQLIMQVVGCTGVVDKVSTALTNFVGDVVTGQFNIKLVTDKVCTVGKKVAVTATSSVPAGNTQEVPKLIDCKEIQQSEDQKLASEAEKQTQIAKATQRREECLNGIAVTLARNQLTAMTRDTLNWVNSGFNGDPLYVQDITSFTNSLEKNVIETGIRAITASNKAYPYGADFSRSVISGYNSGSSLRTGSRNFLDSLTSDLGNFITDPRSYYSESTLDRANGANDAFANDFSTGGWDGWLALTQRDQNNPLGFTMKASQYLADQQLNQTQNAKEEIQTNDGFLSQKKCVLWELWDDNNEPIYDNKENIKTSTTKQHDNDYCVQYTTITPGGLIKDKVSNYLTSPDRQLELVQTINDSLNTLFSSLISKLQGEGLSSLGSDNNYNSTDVLGGYGSNSIFGNDSISGGDLGLGEGSSNSILNSSGYSNGSFDLTRDLGNTFIHTNIKKAGSATWNAKNNTLVNGSAVLKGRSLSMGVAPTDGSGNPLGSNIYYPVSTAGGTKIVENDPNNWEVGDRAFWDGENWQNWKCYKSTTFPKSGACDNQTNPIKKKGILQIQKDYVVAARELLMKLPSVMPKIGELDYCIPGPNPNWRTNASDVEALFTDLASTTHWGGITSSGSLKCADGSDPKNGKCGTFLKKYPPAPSVVSSFVVNGPGTPEYDSYFSVFQDTAHSLWNAILTSNIWSYFNPTKTSPGPWFKDWSEITDPDEITLSALNIASSSIKTFYKQYGDYIDSVYGSRGLMQTPYLETENSSELIPNPAYLPMASEGLNITKDIVSYNDTITSEIDAYRQSVIDANSNIGKLTEIKNQVSAIIKAAKDRRDAALIEELGLTYDRKLGTPYDQYLKKYKSCLDEESIIYYDDYRTPGTSIGTSAERCNDGLDNDLDGLVDKKDPDCTAITAETAAETFDNITSDPHLDSITNHLLGQ